MLRLLRLRAFFNLEVPGNFFEPYGFALSYMSPIHINAHFQQKSMICIRSKVLKQDIGIQNFQKTVPQRREAIFSNVAPLKSCRTIKNLRGKTPTWKQALVSLGFLRQP